MTIARTWPPPPCEEDDDDDPDDSDASKVCEACQGSPCSPGLAWNAYYVEGYSPGTATVSVGAVST